MKNLNYAVLLVLVLSACTSTKELSYLSNLPDISEEQYFPMEVPDYRVQHRDVLYITAKAMTPDGGIEDMLSGRMSYSQSTLASTEASQYLMGYNVDEEGYIFLPIIGKIEVTGHTLTEIRDLLQREADSHFRNVFVECKLLSFKFTVLGEAKAPGTYINYNNYLTVLEAVGRAGGVSDYGRRDKILVVRPTFEGTKTYWINLQDKNILNSEAFFLQPNDIVIIEPVSHKIFNLNLPTYSFVLTSVTSIITASLLLINYFGK